ncbi:MAG: hypothetical protein CM1200mP2_49270 [Planctomycetaceae bacterium]|nr:MAG: hypothetical protein CM1200mP2_49270 [Planctomycetaceae bacterium]
MPTRNRSRRRGLGTQGGHRPFQRPGRNECRPVERHHAGSTRRILLRVDIESQLDADNTFRQLLGRDASERYRVIMDEAKRRVTWISRPVARATSALYRFPAHEADQHGRDDEHDVHCHLAAERSHPIWPNRPMAIPDSHHADNRRNTDRCQGHALHDSPTVSRVRQDTQSDFEPSGQAIAPSSLGRSTNRWCPLV